MKLIAPVRVIAVLKMELLSQGRRQGYLAAVLAHSAAQGADWVVVLAPCSVIPPLDGHGREPGVASGHRMRPCLLGKAADGCLERTASQGRAQERAHHGESKPRPLGACRIGGWLDHHASRGRGERTVTIRFHRSRSVGEEHLLRIEGDHCETLICRPPGTVIGERNRSRSIQPSRGG